MNKRSIFAAIAYRRLSDEDKRLVRMDVQEYTPYNESDPKAFMRAFRTLMLMSRSFRNVFYYRCNNGKARAARFWAKPSRVVLPRVPSIEICTNDIGGGLRIAHNVCTIGAERIGEHTSFGPGCVVGTSKGRRPIIEDGVHVCANAIVIGGVTIGKNSTIGAGAVVFEDVPPNSTVVGNPGRILRSKRKQL